MHIREGTANDRRSIAGLEDDRQPLFSLSGDLVRPLCHDVFDIQHGQELEREIVRNVIAANPSSGKLVRWKES